MAGFMERLLEGGALSYVFDQAIFDRMRGQSLRAEEKRRAAKLPAAVSDSNFLGPDSCLSSLQAFSAPAKTLASDGPILAVSGPLQVQVASSEPTSPGRSPCDDTIGVPSSISCNEALHSPEPSSTSLALSDGMTALLRAAEAWSGPEETLTETTHSNCAARQFAGHAKRKLNETGKSCTDAVAAPLHQGAAAVDDHENCKRHRPLLAAAMEVALANAKMEAANAEAKAAAAEAWAAAAAAEARRLAAEARVAAAEARVAAARVRVLEMEKSSLELVTCERS